jgi:PAS domain S-box-containing protein
MNTVLARIIPMPSSSLEESRLNAVQEDTNDFICRFDLDRNITYANGYLRACLEEHEKDLAGRLFPHRILEEDRPGVVAALKRMIANPTHGAIPNPIAFRVGLPSGEIRYQRWRVREILDEFGDVVEFQAVGHDFTENVNCRSATACLKTVHDFNREISHDLNNLLMHLSGAVEISLNNLSDEDRLRRRLETVLVNLDRVKGLSQKLHSLNEGIPMVDVFDPVQLAERLLKSLFLESSVKWSLHADEPEYQIVGEEHEMERVFLNLFQNASEAMDGSGRLEIEFETRAPERTFGFRPEKHLFIRISDTGRGMSEDVRGRLFKRQFTTKANGHGIGLSIVQKIVRRFDGTITTHSEVGRGTTFEIEIPLANQA